MVLIELFLLKNWGPRVGYIQKNFLTKLGPGNTVIFFPEHPPKIQFSKKTFLGPNFLLMKGGPPPLDKPFHPKTTKKHQDQLLGCPNPVWAPRVRCLTSNGRKTTSCPLFGPPGRVETRENPPFPGPASSGEILSWAQSEARC